MRYLLALVSIVLFATISFSATINVPADQSTIQAGIDAAVNGDTVLVAPGTYHENINYSGKNIVVLGQNGPEVTIIQALNTNAPVVSFVSGEPKGSEICGFTITGSFYTGIHGLQSSPTIRNNIITGNSGGDAHTAAAIDMDSTSGSLITYNYIYNNSVGLCTEIVLFRFTQNDTMSHNVLFSNSGGSTISGVMSIVSVINNTISGGNAYGIVVDYVSSFDIRNNIISGVSQGVHVDIADGSTALVDYNCAFGNGDDFHNASGIGNIFEDALFVDPLDNNYSLSYGSPCIDAGDPDLQYNDPDGTRNDIGAFYFDQTPKTINVPADYPTIQAGIDAAISGDTVLVAPGTYTGEGNIDVAFNKPIVVVSSRGPDSTVIDCQSLGRGLTIGSQAISLRGFSIRNGSGRGGAIYSNSSAASIKQCNFSGNTGDSGGAIYINTGGLNIDSCFFEDNFSESTGGAITDRHAFSTISYCLFNNNISSSAGGGVHCSSSSTVIRNCTFISNNSSSGNSVNLNFDGNATVINCLFTQNGNGSVIGCEGDNYPSLSCCNMYGNNSGDWTDCVASQLYVNGNLRGFPYFCDTTNGNYSIADASICAPENNECGELIGAFGVGCSAVPGVAAFGINEEVISNIISQYPEFGWTMDNPFLSEQTAFEIAVGTDDDWAYAEMWNPAPVASADTFVVYNGSPLVDGQTYYARLRVNNGYAWSDWAELSFRMNTPPEMPTALSPADSVVVESDQPWLTVLNAIDAEGDALFYDFQCYIDCTVVTGDGIPQTPDSTGWMVDYPLFENGSFAWQARSFDGFEYSDWTVPEIFFVNAFEESPAPFAVTYPPDTSGAQVCDLPATFQWQPSFNADPLDSVHYRLIVALDANFTFTATYDNIYAVSRAVDLNYGTHYWWKAQAIDTKGNMTESDNVADFLTWVLGDANGDGAPNIGDAIFIINFVFRGGDAPMPLKTGDFNGDCEVNIGDAVYMINFIFRGGAAPMVGCAVEVGR